MINNNTKQRIYTSIFLFFLCYLIIISNFMLAYMLIIVGIYSILEFLYISKKIFKNNFYKFFLNTLCIVYIFVFFSLFFFFSNFLQSKIILYLLLFGCIASDIGFVFGKIFMDQNNKNKSKKTYRCVWFDFIRVLLYQYCFRYLVSLKRN